MRVCICHHNGFFRRSMGRETDLGEYEERVKMVISETLSRMEKT